VTAGLSINPVPRTPLVRGSEWTFRTASFDGGEV